MTLHTTTVKLRPDQRDALAERAATDGQSQAAHIRAAIDAYLGTAAPAIAPPPISADDRSIIRSALRRWGAEAQFAVAQEELAELVVALSHHRRGRKDAVAEVVEECADVRVMLAQVEAALGIEGEVEGRRRVAMRRLARLVEAG